MTAAAHMVATELDIGSAVAAAVEQLARAGVDNPHLDARLLVGAATGESAASVIAYSDRMLSPDEDSRLVDLVARRCAREPLAHILGVREFWSLEFQVGADVLTPRPDSETLIEAALDEFADRRQPLRILDFGTGSGCLLIALLSEYQRATGIGVDASAPAVRLARQNAQRLGVAERAEFVVGDWANGVTGKFDLIVSNPPYICSGDIAGLEPEVAQFEPRGALDGGEDGFDAFKSLLPMAVGLQAPGGVALIEFGIGQADVVSTLARDAGYEVAAIRPDIAQIPRVAILRR